MAQPALDMPNLKMYTARQTRGIWADCAKDARGDKPVGDDEMKVACKGCKAPVLQVGRVLLELYRLESVRLEMELHCILHQ